MNRKYYSYDERAIRYWQNKKKNKNICIYFFFKRMGKGGCIQAIIECFENQLWVTEYFQALIKCQDV